MDKRSSKRKQTLTSLQRKLYDAGSESKPGESSEAREKRERPIMRKIDKLNRERPLR